LKKLPRSFYERPTLTVARELLGKYIVRHHRGTKFVGRIVETEAYRGKLDPAAHTYRGKTKRNEVMYWGGGHLYVYFTYGMHFCANVVTGGKESGEAVLIRALEPLEGIEAMVKNRAGTRKVKTPPGSLLYNLTNGPARLCEALSIRREQNGTNLLGNEIYLLDAPPLTATEVTRSTRVGITNGKEKKWRFTIKTNRWVSR
jgi:DNA-3-methyladenine glycosylase